MDVIREINPEGGWHMRLTITGASWTLQPVCYDVNGDVIEELPCEEYFSQKEALIRSQEWQTELNQKEN